MSSPPVSPGAVVLLSIPLYYLLALLPHFYSIYLISSARKQSLNSAPREAPSSAASKQSPSQASNITKSEKPTYDATNPRSSTMDTHLHHTLPPHVYARYTRSRSAHSNTIENLPITVAGVLITAFHPTLSSIPTRLPFSSSSSSSIQASLPPLAETLCWIALFLRAVYLVVYIFLLEGKFARRLVLLRTGVWQAGMWCYLAVILMAAFV